jgi:TfoX/Sxy family transcriptional regulator of competence genes
MASQQSLVDFIVDQMAAAGLVSARKMFGEYGVYCDGKIVALICDDQLFVKPTAAGRAHIGHVVEASPYKGAKPCFLIPEDKWDDADWMAELVKVSAAELPSPKPKKSAAKKASPRVKKPRRPAEHRAKKLTPARRRRP